MRRSLFVLLTLASLAVPAIAGGGKQVRYVDIHPIPRSEGGGICYIEGRHVHLFDADRIQYRDHHGASYFVGDPVAYGYDGPRHAYKGHHPIHVSVVVDHEPIDAHDDEYCYLSGPHYHAFAPPEGPEFKREGDVYFYVAEPPSVYVEARPTLMKIDAVYEPIVYTRPVVEVEAPVGWIGARAEFMVPAVVVAPRAVIAPPRAGVTVHVPVPS
ncbi:MAG: hypothetical protein H7138_26335, partial [Myxococcales bacterium]|nr:hypothetical protein [Myxococcales bacterium]